MSYQCHLLIALFFSSKFNKLERLIVFLLVEESLKGGAIIIIWIDQENSLGIQIHVQLSREYLIKN